MADAIRSTAGPGGAWIEVTPFGDLTVSGMSLNASWLAGLSDEQLAPFGLERAEIAETEMPTSWAVQVTGSAVNDNAGVPTRVWLTEALDIETVRNRLLAAAAIEYAAHRQRPVAWDFGAVEALDDNDVSIGEAGQQTLQMRDDAVQNDLQNWLAANAAAMAAVAAGMPDLIQPLKTTANVWVQTTAAQVVQVLVTGDGVQVSAFQMGAAHLKAFGALKKAINTAVDIETLVSIDPTAGWPA
ncbi:hypothetical protein [Phenylobacterium sp. 58.2.17]|uniref:hypothetical protein n=1 Tax=Phenylobacterium sp. 58.2.17 TaxID=2969306 RepID=UPI0022642322|nr:hypothetical protein [Phenylobacterium sp. 58.2.17]MCX7585002.1 hypothetical protein [Phenylobacterium sp. 58.2.17]